MNSTNLVAQPEAMMEFNKLMEQKRISDIPLFIVADEEEQMFKKMSMKKFKTDPTGGSVAINLSEINQDDEDESQKFGQKIMDQVKNKYQNDPNRMSEIQEAMSPNERASTFKQISNTTFSSHQETMLRQMNKAADHMENVQFKR
jgi:hypothetical protein